MYWVNGFNQTRMYCGLPLIWMNATVFSISRAVLNSNTVRSANSSFPSYKLLIFFRFIISCFKASPFHTKMQCFQCFCKAAISYLPSWPHAPGKWTTVGSFPWPFPFIHLFLISSEPVIYPLWLAQRLPPLGNLFFFFFIPNPQPQMEVISLFRTITIGMYPWILPMVIFTVFIGFLVTVSVPYFYF